MIGVDYNLFWTLNPKTLSPFVKAFDLKKKYDDEICWRNGYYMLMAIGNCFSKSVKYPKSPMGVSNTSKETEQVMDANDIKAKMFAQAELLNSRFRKEGED